jgi:hypothetical protein
MKVHVGVALYLHAFLLILTLDGDEWSVLRSGRFVPGEVVLSIYRMEGWVVPVDLGALLQTEISRHCRESKAESSVLLPVA